jgi:hypothetical protein
MGPFNFQATVAVGLAKKHFSAPFAEFSPGLDRAEVGYYSITRITVIPPGK